MPVVSPVFVYDTVSLLVMVFTSAYFFVFEEYLYTLYPCAPVTLLHISFTLLYDAEAALNDGACSEVFPETCSEYRSPAGDPSTSIYGRTV